MYKGKGVSSLSSRLSAVVCVLVAAPVSANAFRVVASSTKPTRVATNAASAVFVGAWLVAEEFVEASECFSEVFSEFLFELFFSLICVYAQLVYVLL